MKAELQKWAVLPPQLHFISCCVKEKCLHHFQAGAAVSGFVLQRCYQENNVKLSRTRDELYT